MTNPDRIGRALTLSGAIALSSLTACGPKDPDAVRIDRLEQRVNALEARVSALAPSAAAARAPSPAPAMTGPAEPAKTYLPGAVAIVHAAPSDRAAIAEVPADSVGGFIFSGGALTLHDLSGRGVRYSGLSGVELQGWLKATQAGRYQFGEDLHGTLGASAIVGAACVLEVWLENRVVGSPQGVLAPPNGVGGEQRLSLVAGADLQPGLYKFRLWTTCAPVLPAAAHITADLLLKGPGDMNLRGYKPDDVLYQP